MIFLEGNMQYFKISDSLNDCNLFPELEGEILYGTTWKLLFVGYMFIVEKGTESKLISN